MIILRDPNKEEIRIDTTPDKFGEMEEYFYTQSELSDMDQDDYNYIMKQHYTNNEGMPCKYEYVYIK